MKEDEKKALTEKNCLESEKQERNNVCQYYVGEKVVHIPEGVCLITEISKMRNIDNKECDYYKLVPVEDQSSAVYIPLCSSQKHIIVKKKGSDFSSR